MGNFACPRNIQVHWYAIVPAGTYKGVETDSRAKFGKETVAGAHRRPKWVPHYGAQADSGRAQDAQALLRLYSGMPRL